MTYLKSVKNFWLVLFVLASCLAIALGFSARRADSIPESTVWIGRSDGAKFCVPESGVNLTQGAAELKAARIDVLESKKGTDGKMHAQVCGGARGSLNTYLIHKDKLNPAIALGYTEVTVSRQ